MHARIHLFVLMVSICGVSLLADDGPLDRRRGEATPNEWARASLSYEEFQETPVETPRRGGGIVPALDHVNDQIDAAGAGSKRGLAQLDVSVRPIVELPAWPGYRVRLEVREDGFAVSGEMSSESRAAVEADRAAVLRGLEGWSVKLDAAQAERFARDEVVTLTVSEPFNGLQRLQGGPIVLAIGSEETERDDDSEPFADGDAIEIGNPPKREERLGKPREKSWELPDPLNDPQIEVVFDKNYGEHAQEDAEKVLGRISKALGKLAKLAKYLPPGAKEAAKLVIKYAEKETEIGGQITETAAAIRESMNTKLVTVRVRVPRIRVTIRYAEIEEREGDGPWTPTGRFKGISDVEDRIEPIIEPFEGNLSEELERVLAKANTFARAKVEQRKVVEKAIAEFRARLAKGENPEGGAAPAPNPADPGDEGKADKERAREELEKARARLKELDTQIEELRKRIAANDAEAAAAGKRRDARIEALQAEFKAWGKNRDKERCEATLENYKPLKPEDLSEGARKRIEAARAFLEQYKAKSEELKGLGNDRDTNATERGIWNVMAGSGEKLKEMEREHAELKQRLPALEQAAR